MSFTETVKTYIQRWTHLAQVRLNEPARYSAHIGILVGMLVVAFFGRIMLTPVSGSVPTSTPTQAAPGLAQSLAVLVAAAPERAPQTPLVPPTPPATDETDYVVQRQAQPHTEIPERERLTVIEHKVQPGESVFSIAEKYGLSPYTIAWSNIEALPAPWLIQPGLTLYILPVDGVYHTVLAGETPQSIAAKYGVKVEALYNKWNDIRPNEPLQPGTLLVIPDGEGEDISWEPPQAVPGAAVSWGYCGGTAVSGPGSAGWFILPTGSYYVSGWRFHDPGNPTHIGLDYGCWEGAPIYAADNGVVVWAGWGGGYGNLVQISHGNGYVTYYAHLSEIWVGCGTPVYQGQIIGLCGNTGYSFGSHLHYEIRLWGVPQDPELFEP